MRVILGSRDCSQDLPQFSAVFLEIASTRVRKVDNAIHRINHYPGDSMICYVYSYSVRHFRNVRGLGKSMLVFPLFEKLRYSNERSTKFESLDQE